MSTILWLVIAAIVVVLIIGALAVTRRQRSQRLRGKFGAEYDRTLEARGGNRRAAEQELKGRLNRRKQFQIVPLSEDSRRRYLAEWQRVQTDFVDYPAQSVAAADVLVQRVMRERGYPVGDFDQQAADVSVEHGDVVDHYRAAHAVFTASNRDGAGTEDQRRAMVHYRAMFDELLHASADEERNGRRDERDQSEYAQAGSPSATRMQPQSPRGRERGR